jgi:hypothetical protein
MLPPHALGPDDPPPPCSADPDLWFPAPGTGRSSQRRLALRICDACPVNRKCRQAGTSGDEYGIWGGESRTQRTDRRRRGKRG